MCSRTPHYVGGGALGQIPRSLGVRPGRTPWGTKPSLGHLITTVPHTQDNEGRDAHAGVSTWESNQ